MKKRLIQVMICLLYTIILCGLAASGRRPYLINGIMSASEENDLVFPEAICEMQEKLTGVANVCQIEDFPDCDTAEEMRDYFLKKHPDAESYEVYVPRAETNDNFYPIVAEGNFYLIEEENYVFGYFENGGNAYVVTDKNEVLNFVEKVSGMLWEYQSPIAKWLRHDNGTRWYDYNAWTCEAVMEAETGENFYFEIARKDIDETEEKALEIMVYREGEKEPFQVLETECLYKFYRSYEIFPYDFNMDGYLDFTLQFYVNPQHASEWHYIWSPSKGEFVRGPEELDHWWMATPGRRIATYQNVSGNAQEIWFYQWENEMDYRLIMWYRHEYMYDENAESYLVKSYDEDGKEVLLLDCAVEIGSSEADVADSLIDIQMDVLCGKKIQSEETGKVFYVYLTRSDSYYKEEGKDYLYVIDEALYPVKMLMVACGGNCEEMNWYTDETEKLQILYEDGSLKEFTLEELIGE